MGATVGQLFERCRVDVLAVHGEQCQVCLPEYRGCKSHCIQNVCRRIKAPLDGQYYCSVLYCAIYFYPDGSILFALFHFAHGSGRVNMLGDIYAACVATALTLCLKRNKAGYVGRAAFA